MTSPRPTSARVRLAGPELVLAALAALALAAALVGPRAFDPERVLCAVDTATVQEPWSSVLDAPPEERPRNRGLADQGVFFYPVHRWVAASWLAADPPLWNPWIFAGVPALGNPQCGVLDPQVLLHALLLGLGGEALFDRGFAFLAVGRLALAGLGAYLLARRLGLARAGAALAAATFAGSGFCVLWLGASPMHVGPFLPWVLLGLETIAGRDVRGRSAPRGRGVLLAALALSLAILGGHPETSFFVGAAGGAWALALLLEDRRTGLLALGALAAGTALSGVVLLPFLEYLPRSGAWLARRAASGGGDVDALALGALIVPLGLVLRLRDVPPSVGRRRATWAAAAALAGCALLVAARGAGTSASLLLAPDLFGAPGRGPGYVGPGEYLERAAAWVPAAALALALAALLAPRGEGLRRRGLVAGLGVLALVLALGAPGASELFGLVPLFGLGATARLAVVSSLFLGLLAGEGLERAGRVERVAAAGALALLLVAAIVGAGGDGGEAPGDADPDDEVATFTARPPDQLADAATSRPAPPLVAGWLHPELPAAGARVALVPADGGPAAELPAVLAPTPWPGEADAGAPPGARFFRAELPPLGRVGAGAWRVVLRVHGADGELLGERDAGATRLAPRGRPSPAGLAWIAAGLAVAAFAGGGRGRWLVVLAALGHVVNAAAGQNPAVPRAECFPPTRTEELLARELGARRFLAAPGVLPASANLVRRLRSADGYDALDVATFDLFRPHALAPGTQPLLGWNAHGVDLDAPAFRMLGVSHLLTRTGLAHPGWETVAGPRGGEDGSLAPAEVFVHRARDPLPPAFCAAERVERADVLDDPDAFDPRRQFFLDDDAGPWRPARPFTRAEVSDLVLRNATVHLTAELDGDGLLVLAEQSFPGWEATVDGNRAELLTVDAVFRGVPLAAGSHRVALHYRPRSLHWGIATSLAGVLVLAFLVARGTSRGG